MKRLLKKMYKSSKNFFFCIFVIACNSFGANPLPVKKCSDKISVSEFCRRYNLTCKNYVKTLVCKYSSKGKQSYPIAIKEVVFEKYQRYVTLTDNKGRRTKLFLSKPLERRKLLKSFFNAKEEYFIQACDVAKIFRPVFYPSKVFVKKPKQIFTVVLDPGHGGKDIGATAKYNSRVREKDLTLKTALTLKSILEPKGITVHCTRSSDKQLDLKERSSFANTNAADLFVSIHYNSCASDKAKGIESYVLPFKNTPSSSCSRLRNAAEGMALPGNNYDESNSFLGYLIQRNLTSTFAKKYSNNFSDRGLKRGRFGVLKNLNCPGILIEGGFLSNKSELKEINSEIFREKFAKALSDGIIEYAGTVCSNINSTSSVKKINKANPLNRSTPRRPNDKTNSGMVKSKQR